MGQKLRNDYLILGASLALLAVGWGLDQFWALVAAAAIGFALALALVIQAIRHREFGSDALALLAIVASALVEEWLAAAVITVMLATGRSLERWAQGRANGRLAALLDRAPRFAHVVDASDRVSDVALAQVAVGSRILVRSGEIVPLDGQALSRGSFDESALTGEPLPREVNAGDEVASGVVNAGSSIELTTTSSEADSTYSALVRLVAESSADSANGVRLANRWALWFVPFALALAATTWIVSGDPRNAVAVIVAATPCPLILAVPIAIIAGMSRSAATGSIVKGGQSLESLARAKFVILDKTGTLTHGGPSVDSILVAPGYDEVGVLRAAASLELASPHVVARAVVAAAQDRDLELSRPSDTAEVHGHGLEGSVDGIRVRVGQPTGDLPDWANSQILDDGTSLLVAVEFDGSLVGIVTLQDPVRNEAKQTVDALHAQGVAEIWMATGDRRSTAEQVAKTVGIDRVLAEATPADKLDLVHELMSRGGTGTVIAVGDGINDAPALAAAHVGVAMGARGATAASEAADVVIIEDSIDHLSSAIAVAKGAMRRAKQAALVGVSLSVIAMLAGAFGLLSPTAAALSQEAIDACAILWALVPPLRTSRSNR